MSYQNNEHTEKMSSQNMQSDRPLMIAVIFLVVIGLMAIFSASAPKCIDIQFIEIYKKDKSELHLKYLNPGDIAEFNITCLPEEIDAIEFCNIHGLWGENKND